jgi:GTPase SAR1 family protein
MTITVSQAIAQINSVKRIAILGDGAVGKTTFVKTLKEGFSNPREQDTKRTPFIEFDTFHIDSSKILCYDLAGQDSLAHPLRTMADQVLKNTHVILLTFSVNRFKSLYNLQNWFLSVKKYYEGKNEIIPPILLVGTKMDLNMKIDLDFINLMVSSLPEIVDFVNVSSYTGAGIKDFKKKLSKIILESEIKIEEL